MLSDTFLVIRVATGGCGHKKWALDVYNTHVHSHDFSWTTQINLKIDVNGNITEPQKTTNDKDGTGQDGYCEESYLSH